MTNKDFLKTVMLKFENLAQHNQVVEKPVKTAIRFLCPTKGCKSEHYILNPMLGQCFYCKCGGELEVTCLDPPTLEDSLWDDYKGADHYNDRKPFKDYDDFYNDGYHC